MTLSRRSLLQAGALGGLALAATSVLAACTPQHASGIVDVQPTGTPRRGGTFIHGAMGSGSTGSLSPWISNTSADFARYMAMYETLWYSTGDYRIKPRLVDTYSVNAAADEWTIKLKSGITFHNGKPLTANDVFATFRSIQDPATAASSSGALSVIDLGASTIVDPLTFRLKLKTGTSNLPEILSTFVPIVPEGFDIAKPVGTGPFKLKSFVPGQQTHFVRYENYWQIGKPYLDELVIVDFNEDAARVNALASGQILGADTIDFTLSQTLRNKPEVALLVQKTNSFYPLQMRMDQAPFDDVRVRQAFRLLVDREELTRGAYNGFARSANDLYSPSDPLFDTGLAPRHQDLDKAKYLLKQAGAEKLQVTLTTSDFGAGVVSMSQLFAQQAKAAGVTVHVNKLDSATFFGSNYGTYLFSPNVAPPFNYLYTVQTTDGPTSTSNYSAFKDEEFTKLYAQLAPELNPTRAKEIAADMQKIQYDRGSLIIPNYYDAIDGHSKKLGGIVPDVSGLALYRYANLWLAS
ncbi:ABC transporter substrate-binding protein [Leifsonia shinshuensis]|uniref:ABC transporter substrate-binding protein n=1 Tax=Leifsonia shinshuensis TaxID=150026 RepID=A0A7G6YA91_9MICO|nr:ABC transporter substrate-binding protein [Leifsonia shinshuensis]QNE35406.1 ABC transporter substrate-binding protein [Leifsonia shinshuensis]